LGPLRAAAAALTAIVAIGVAGQTLAAGSPAKLTSVPDHGHAGSSISVTYAWPGCGGIAADYYVVDLYWDSTKNPPLATAQLTPYPYDGKSDCGASFDTAAPKDATAGSHTLIAEVTDLKAGVEAGSNATSSFTIEAPKATPTAVPKATAIPTPKVTASSSPKRSAAPGVTATSGTGTPAQASPSAQVVLTDTGTPSAAAVPGGISSIAEPGPSMVPVLALVALVLVFLFVLRARRGRPATLAASGPRAAGPDVPQARYLQVPADSFRSDTDALPEALANRLQRAMDRDSRFADTISNLLKDEEDSADAQAKNQK
jgi:hypothetical protein